jgi:hypothetical protein
MGIGFAGQQSLGIGAGTVGLVAELDTAKVALGSLLSLFGSTVSFARSSRFGLTGSFGRTISAIDMGIGSGDATASSKLEPRARA